ncbi:hypothetical protein L1D14_18095 [Vibrio tubiashii]|uniref:hypothetical protein n=1 Tax=Vibrio tubiashii TaxID=29498 RepID=UPI001EFEB2F2|nr:hypothetical protein [Vibrio tubiashii]MCG9578129.1 hypothetical protein [Vibrio tubiashii]
MELSFEESLARLEKGQKIQIRAVELINDVIPHVSLDSERLQVEEYRSQLEEHDLYEKLVRYLNKATNRVCDEVMGQLTHCYMEEDEMPTVEMIQLAAKKATANVVRKATVHVEKQIKKAQTPLEEIYLSDELHLQHVTLKLVNEQITVQINNAPIEYENTYTAFRMNNELTELYAPHFKLKVSSTDAERLDDWLMDMYI